MTNEKQQQFQRRGLTPALRRDVLGVDRVTAMFGTSEWHLLQACRSLAKDHGGSIKEGNDAYRAAMRSLGLSDALPRIG